MTDFPLVEPGDSGAWVVDSDGQIYGHIVAGDPMLGLAFIIPAYKVFDDIKRRFGSEALCCHSLSTMQPYNTLKNYVSGSDFSVGMTQIRAPSRLIRWGDYQSLGPMHLASLNTYLLLDILFYLPLADYGMVFIGLGRVGLGTYSALQTASEILSLPLHLPSANGSIMSICLLQRVALVITYTREIVPMRPYMSVQSGAEYPLAAIIIRDGHELRTGEIWFFTSSLSALSASNSALYVPWSRCAMWDVAADGYARSEGAAAVILKTLSQAMADDDLIDCIIREAGVNQDGRTPGLTIPSSLAQAALIRQCYAKAGLDPINNPQDRPQFFQAHGTGASRALYGKTHLSQHEEDARFWGSRHITSPNLTQVLLTRLLQLMFWNGHSEWQRIARGGRHARTNMYLACWSEQYLQTLEQEVLHRRSGFCRGDLLSTSMINTGTSKQLMAAAFDATVFSAKAPSFGSMVPSIGSYTYIGYNLETATDAAANRIDEVHRTVVCKYSLRTAQ